MKKILFLLLIASTVMQGQKIKNLPATITGTTNDYIIKDYYTGASNSTQKMRVSDFITTYGLVNAVTPPAPIFFTQAATTAALTTVTYLTNTLTATANGALGAIDGVTLAANEYLLVKDQTAQLQNGVYEVTDLGSAGTPYILVRDTLCDETAEMYPSQVNVINGTINANTYHLQTTQSPVVGTTAIVYTTTEAPDLPDYSVGANLISISANTWRSDTSVWVKVAGGVPTITIEDAPGSAIVPTGKVHQFSGANSWHKIDQLIAINTDLTYYGKIWASLISGSGNFRAGYIAYDKDLNTLAGNDGASSTYGYFIANAVTPGATGTWYDATITGEGTALATFPVGTRFIKPLIITNYPTAGVMQVAGFEISDRPFETSAGVMTIASPTVTVTSLTASLPVFTDASKGLTTNAITGTGSVVMSTSPTLVTPALGTPSALVGTNITGTAASLTAGNVTTNANLTGEVTSVGNAAVLGSFTSTVLATALTNETGTGAAVFATSPTLVTPILGTPTSGVATNLTGTASGLTAGNVTTNANLTGDVTSVGNATTIAANAVDYSMMQVVTTDKLLGSGSGTAVAEITLGTNLSFTGATLNAAGASLFTQGTGYAYLTTTTDDFQVGNATDMSASLGVKGQGATSATTSFLAENSAGTDGLEVLDNTHSLFGGATETNAQMIVKYDPLVDEAIYTKVGATTIVTIGGGTGANGGRVNIYNATGTLKNKFDASDNITQYIVAGGNTGKFVVGANAEAVGVSKFNIRYDPSVQDGMQLHDGTGRTFLFTQDGAGSGRMKIQASGTDKISFTAHATNDSYINNGGGLAIGATTTTDKLGVTGTFGVTGDATLGGRLLKNQGTDVASVAGAITLAADGSVFEITGTNAITLISNLSWQNGSEVTLIFTSTATLTDGTATSTTNVMMRLAGAANFVATADDSITLTLCEIGGVQVWREKCRSVN